MGPDEQLARFDVALVRADNPGPFTLSGTNTWVVGRDPCVVVDPGPDLDAHVEAVLAEAGSRGGVGMVALTHDHADHAEALPRMGDAPVARAGRAGPLRSVPTPGHTADHVAWVLGEDVAFSGDAVLGEGSVFLTADLGGYLEGLADLRAIGLALVCPGHGPLVTDPDAKLDEVVAHRRDRERRLVAALDEGRRTVEEILDSAWSEVPAGLRPAAGLTLNAHLDKLGGEGRLPEGVERFSW